MKRLVLSALAIPLLAYALASNARGTNSEKIKYQLDEVIEKIAGTAWPADYELFRDLGVSSFGQVNSSGSLNIAFRSKVVETKDGYGIKFIEYRIPPQLNRGMSFLYLEMDKARCYDIAPMKQKYELRTYIAPPNPHDPRDAHRKKDSLYKVTLDKADLLLSVSADGKNCLLGISRSQN